jgi:hypothetical protein
MKLVMMFIVLMALRACQFDNNIDTKDESVIIIAESFYTEPECNPYIDFDNLEMNPRKPMEGLMQEVH